MSESPGIVTQLLKRLSHGDRGAFDKLIPLIYSELHARAVAYMKKERAGHTLQPTALVNEAYLRLVDQNCVGLSDRSHFFAVAARTMRRILIEHARSQQARKRGGDRRRIPLQDVELGSFPSSIDLLALEDTLRRLESYSSRMSQVVELRFFGGLSTQEVAQYLNVDPATVKRDWKAAKIILLDELSDSDP